MWYSTSRDEMEGWHLKGRKGERKGERKEDNTRQEKNKWMDGCFTMERWDLAGTDSGNCGRALGFIPGLSGGPRINRDLRDMGIEQQFVGGLQSKIQNLLALPVAQKSVHSENKIQMSKCVFEGSEQFCMAYVQVPD